MKRKQFLQSLFGLAVTGLLLPVQPLWAQNIMIGGDKEKKVKQKLLEFIEQSVGEKLDLTIFDWNSSYRDAGMDSLDWVECMMNIEKHYQITIPDTELNALDTPQQLVDIVLKMAKRMDIK